MAKIFWISFAFTSIQFITNGRPFGLAELGASALLALGFTLIAYGVTRA